MHTVRQDDAITILLMAINEGITDVVEENIELKARVKNLREDRNQA